MIALSILKWVGIVLGVLVLLVGYACVCAVFAALLIMTVNGELDHEPTDGDHEA